MLFRFLLTQYQKFTNSILQKEKESAENLSPERQAEKEKAWKTLDNMIPFICLAIAMIIFGLAVR